MTLSWISKLLLMPTLLFSLFFLIKYLVSSISRWSGWTGSEWAAAGAWFGGLMTFGAVSAALLQTWLGRRDAKEAAERADARLFHELDSKRRDEMLKAIPPIWAAIADLNQPYIRAREAIYEVANAPSRTVELAERLYAEYMPWLDALKNLEMVFTPALMMVTEPNTQQAITDLYEDTRELLDKSFDALGDVVQHHESPNMHEVETLMRKINMQRKSMTQVVRMHLTEAQPLVSRRDRVEDQL
ncbi:hypothetical protein RHDE110596_00625 [Prescottella defluvii]|uniref:hypothetical protein n=1 Tax=Prescottella defluvii TaxID=1323361 RepID=UPI0004F2477D|nr:hypothetical protein [Prescottella defluvii]